MSRAWPAWVLACALLLLPARLPAQGIGSIMSSFTVANRTGEVANDFHLIISGVDAVGMGENVGPPGWLFSSEILPNGTLHLMWQGGPPVWPGESRPFGLRLPGSPQWRIVCAYWTADGRLLFPLLSWPNQRWDVQSGQFVDIVDGYRAPLSPLVTITREWSAVPMPIPLSELTWDATAMLPWQPSNGPEPIPTMPDSFFDIFLETFGMPAALVRYPVLAAGEVVAEARYTNQVVLGDFLPPQMFSNFDVVNRGDLCANDFHVLLSGVSCAQLLAGPQGLFSPPGWNCVCLDLPGGLGCELRWSAVDGSCVLPGELRHFGYGLSGIPQFQITAAWWTWNGVPILPFLDVVQQTWQSGFTPGQVVDRVWGRPPLVEPAGVFFQREWAWTSQPLALTELGWEQTLPLPWLPADPGQMLAPPDPQFQLPFLFPMLPEGANALIRYQAWGEGEALLLTFVNQALADVAPPIPPIEDLSITYLGEVEPGVHGLRLNWTPPPSPTGAPLIFRVIGYTNPYDESTALTQGTTVESFFDVFTEISGRTQAPPQCFRVVSDYQAPTD